MFEHLIGTLGYTLRDPALTALVHYDLGPSARDKVKTKEFLAVGKSFSATKEVQTVLKEAQRVTIHGSGLRLRAPFC